MILVFYSRRTFTEISELQSKANTVVLFQRITTWLESSPSQIIEETPGRLSVNAEKGIEVYMITGDNIQTASAVASEAGLKISDGKMPMIGRSYQKFTGAR